MSSNPAILVWAPLGAENPSGMAAEVVPAAPGERRQLPNICSVSSSHQARRLVQPFNNRPDRLLRSIVCGNVSDCNDNVSCPVPRKSCPLRVDEQ